jgi:hypothetical protein
MLWPDGRLEIPEETRQRLRIEGRWQCSLEVVDGARVVRPQVAIPDEDLWAYEPETHARLLEAARQPPDQAVRFSPRDFRDLAERRVTVDELIARSKR